MLTKLYINITYLINGLSNSFHLHEIEESHGTLELKNVGTYCGSKIQRPVGTAWCGASLESLGGWASPRAAPATDAAAGNDAAPRRLPGAGTPGQREEPEGLASLHYSILHLGRGDVGIFGQLLYFITLYLHRMGIVIPTYTIWYLLE